MSTNIATAQYPITAHLSFKAWQQHTAAWVAKAVKQKAQLLVFPEYAAMELVSLMPKETQADLHLQLTRFGDLLADYWEVYSDLAKQHQVTIVAPSCPVLADGQMLNRVAVFSPKGLLGYQDKFFMTRFEKEDWGIEAPKIPKLTVFETDWGIFGVQICYDVEFPLGAFHLCQAGALLLLAPSCTETIQGATRVHIGARARALENQCYVAVSQVVGEALWSKAVDINYGFAAVYATPDLGFPAEGIISKMSPTKKGWLIQSLDFEKIANVRRNGQVFNFLQHQDVGYTLRGEAVEVVRVR
jgi:predicted amidohydrolase